MVIVQIQYHKLKDKLEEDAIKHLIKQNSNLPDDQNMCATSFKTPCNSCI